MWVSVDWTGADEDQDDVNVWEDNWDDDNIEDDFSQQLRSVIWASINLLQFVWCDNAKSQMSKLAVNLFVEWTSQIAGMSTQGPGLPKAAKLPTLSHQAIAYWTICQQTNSQSVKPWNGQLKGGLVNSPTAICLKSQKDYVIFYTESIPSPNRINYWKFQ